MKKRIFPEYKMKVYLVHSYRGHGKDSFCFFPEKFEIISPSGGGDLLFVKHLKKYAFADAVKDEVYPILFGEEKNITREMKDEKRGEIIRYAEEKKKEDVNVWVKIVAQKIITESSPLLSSPLEDSVIISDWRFVNEREYLLSLGWDVVTIKVVSLFAPIPEEKEEHNLDDVADDFIVRWKE